MKPYPTMPTLRVFISVPSVGVADRDHDAEHVVPRLGIEHGGVGEHAAVPADVLEGAGRLAGVVAHPGAGVAHDIELAVGVAGLAVAAGLVVRTRAFDGPVVLRHVEVDGPRTKCARH